MPHARRWPIGAAAIVAALGALAGAAWWLPLRLLPVQVVRRSPWNDPAFRAIVADTNAWEEWCGRVASWGPAATPRLVRALSSPAVEARVRASASIAYTRYPAAVPALIVALDDPDNAVRGYAIRALGELRDPRACDPLLDRYRYPRCPDRASCAYRLGFVGDTRLAALLVAGRGDADPQVRNGVACSLRHLRDPSAVGPLIAAAADPVDYVRFNVQGALTDATLTQEQRERLSANLGRGIRAEREAAQGAGS